MQRSPLQMAFPLFAERDRIYEAVMTSGWDAKVRPENVSSSAVYVELKLLASAIADAHRT